MTEGALHPTPPLRGVLREQVRAVALALRGPAALAVALLAAATVLFATTLPRGGEGVGFHPERWILPGLAGVLLPAAVWKGEARFGTGFLWTLPVDRRHHALARVFAGWVWLMAAVALFVLWLLALALVSGGNVLGEETLRIIPAFPLPGPEIDAAAVRTARWTPQPLLWLVPFAAATATYLLASAVALGTRHALRWVVGTALGVFLLVTLAQAGSAAWADAAVRLLASLAAGRYGLETLLIAGTESLKVETVLSTGQAVVVWRGLPDPGQWATAALLWTAAGLAALWAAASRHRETRRA